MLSSLAFGLLWALALPGVAAAQETPAPVPAAPEAVPEAPEVLAASDVPGAADATVDRLREIDSFLEQADTAAAIREQLPAVEETLAQLSAELDARPPNELSLRHLDRSIQAWKSADEPLERWGGQLEAKASQVEKKLAELAEMRGPWQETRDGLPEEAPEAARERVASVLGRIGQTETSCQARLDELVTLQDDVLDRRTRIDEALTLLEEAQSFQSVEFFTLERPPLWEMLASKEHRDTLGSQALEDWEDNWAVIESFVADNRGGLVAQAVVFAVLLALILLLRARSREWMESNPQLKAPSRILARPASAALLLTLIASELFYGPMPYAVYELLLLLILVPVLSLLPGLVASHLRLPMFVIGGLFVLDRIRELLGAETLAGRLVLLAVTVAGLAGLLWAVRPSVAAPGGEAGGRWWRLTVHACRLAAVPLAGSIVANVVGSVRLAWLLSSATLLAAYAAVILLTGVLVARALLRVAMETPAARSVRVLRLYSEPIQRNVGRAIEVGAFAWWLWTVLDLFLIQDRVWGAVSSVLFSEWTVGKITLSLGAVLAFVVTLWVSALLSRWIQIGLEEGALTRVELPPGAAYTISRMARYGVLSLGFLAAASAAGFELSQLAIVFGSLGVGIGFGLQDLVKNFVSGLILAFERPVRVGDAITAAGLGGRVSKIGIRSSTVRTWEGAEVVVPNGQLIAGELVNWTLSDRRRRMELPVGVAYGTDPRRVVELLVAAVEQHEEVLSEPAPQALFKGFGESSLAFVVRFWTADFDHWVRIASEVAVSVSEALAAAEIAIPFPQRDLHVRTMDASVAGRSEGGSGATTT